MDDIALTDLQRSMLCWLVATDGQPPRTEGIEESNHALAHEVKTSLVNLGLVQKPTYEGRGYAFRPTDLGIARAEKIRYASGCPACVTAFCVCRVRIVCAAGCGNAGCHGSHE